MTASGLMFEVGSRVIVGIAVGAVALGGYARAGKETQNRGICSLRSPDGYVHFIGKSYKPKDALAGPEARLDAQQQVKAKVCSSLTEEFLCEMAIAPARRFREGRDADGSMCSVYQMHSEALDPQSKASSDLASTVRSRIESLGLNISTAYVVNRASNGASGCGVGRIGRVLNSELKKQLDVGTNAGAEVISPVLETSKDRVFFHLEHRSRDQQSRQSDSAELTKFVHFMGWDPSETRCGTSTSMPRWFPRAMDKGEGLLEIGRSGRLCSGDTVSLSAVPPARSKTVDLLTIEPNGKVYFIASRPVKEGTKADLGEFAVYSGANAITATVVAAFRSGKDSAPRASPCLLTTNQVENFDQSSIALGSLAYDVEADGEQQCEVTEQSTKRADALKKMLVSMPNCIFDD